MTVTYFQEKNLKLVDPIPGECLVWIFKLSISSPWELLCGWLVQSMDSFRIMDFTKNMLIHA